MRKILEDIGLDTRMDYPGNRIMLFRECDGKTLVRPEEKILYISHEAVVFKKRGIVVVYRSYLGYYGLLTLIPKPKEGGYWTIDSEGRWDPPTNVDWEIRLWSEEKIIQVSARETIYALEGGWFGAFGSPHKFDCNGEFKGPEHTIPAYP